MKRQVVTPRDWNTVTYLILHYREAALSFEEERRKLYNALVVIAGRDIARMIFKEMKLNWRGYQ